MAEQVKDFDWLDHPQGRKNKYPWNEWFNGETWKLERGVDFKVDPKSFRDQAHGRGYYKRHKVRCSIDGDTVYLQAYGFEGDTTT
jgi:hypothetical protein